MKSIRKYLLIAICCISATVFTSCLSSDPAEPYVPLTNTEKAMQLTNMYGVYNGFANYYHEYFTSGQNQTPDSIGDISIQIGMETDSTLTVKNIPLYLFAGSGNNDALTSVLKSTTGDLKCNLQMYKLPYGGDYDIMETYFFAVWPYNAQTWEQDFNYTLNEQPQTMKVEFSMTYASGMDSGYGINMFVKSKKAIQFFIVPKKVTLGDGTVKNVSDVLQFIAPAGK